jgi:hypothetical protein
MIKDIVRNAVHVIKDFLVHVVKKDEYFPNQKKRELLDKIKS